LRRCLRLEDVDRLLFFWNLAIISHEFPNFRGNWPGKGKIIILWREYFIHLHETAT
jgi:hypothetical protein